jgi:hypothetical protein
LVVSRLSPLTVEHLLSALHSSEVVHTSVVSLPRGTILSSFSAVTITFFSSGLVSSVVLVFGSVVVVSVVVGSVVVVAAVEAASALTRVA